MTSPLPYPTAAVPPKPPRPAVVTIAFYLQLVTAALPLVVVAMLIGRALHYDSLIDEAAQLTHPDPADVSSERVGNVFGTVVPGVLCLLFAAGLAGLAVPVRRGGNVTRILTLVLSGLPLLFVLGPGGGLMGLPLAFMTDPGSLPDDPTLDAPVDTSASDQFWTALDKADGAPDVWVIIAAVAGVLLAVALTVLVVLLLVPPAHRFFVPPRPAPALLAYPGQPVAWPAGQPVVFSPPPGPAYPVYVYPAPHPAWPHQAPPPSAWPAPAWPDQSPPSPGQGEQVPPSPGQGDQVAPPPPGGSPPV